jgi:two-component system sensor histidine kinase HupT/HoxJ
MKWVVVRVMDDGPGISPEVEDKIYQPFFSTKPKANSAGLGLNVAAGFAEQIGGSLRHCTESDFTCFELLLPARTNIGN